MNSLFVATILAALAFANAGLLVGPSARVLQGPSTKTTVVGPDGSAISSVAPGGSIITEEHPGVVAHTAPVVAAAPAVAAYSALPLASTYGYAAPVVSHGLLADTVVSGPSGVIARSSNLAAPALVSHGLYY